MNHDYTEIPTLTIAYPGNLGNRLCHFFGAHYLQHHIPGIRIANIAFPEWNIFYPRVENAVFRSIRIAETFEQLDVRSLSVLFAERPSTNVIITSYLQDIERFLPPGTYREMFPLSEVETFGPDHLLINIRTGDILTGFAHMYPLIPIAFYEDLCARTGLTPVFMGQLDRGSRYVEALRAAFPAARFIESRGPVQDFDMIRRAENVVPSVSSFSVMAAWLSEAKRIFLPLNGFLNPSHMRNINLVPTRDPRYRFFLFPMNFALPEQEALAHHGNLRGRWREISASHVEALKRRDLMLPLDATWPENHKIPLFDERWYLHSYIDAADSVSSGTYENGMHHYLDLGRHLGYRIRKSIDETDYPNLALGQRASQSSTSVWSRGRTSTQDAVLAINGVRDVDYAFHTDLERDPWWELDLGRSCIVREIRVYNRKGDRALQERASPISLSLSHDAHSWKTVFENGPGEFFGQVDGGLTPLIVAVEEIGPVRFLRITLTGGPTCLHLAQVEVYGFPS